MYYNTELGVLTFCTLLRRHCRKRNREHAQKSRQKKKILTTTLQKCILQLKVENRKLRNHIYNRLGKKDIDGLFKDKSKEETFVRGVKNLTNNPIDMATQRFLQNLRKSVVLR